MSANNQHYRTLSLSPIV